MHRQIQSTHYNNWTIYACKCIQSLLILTSGRYIKKNIAKYKIIQGGITILNFIQPLSQ